MLALDQSLLKKALRKIGKNVEAHGMLSPDDFNQEDLCLLYSLAVNLYERCEYEESQTIFQRLVLSRPLEKKFWMGLGSSFQMSENYEEALNAWSMASLIDDEDPAPHLHAAECLFSMTQQDQALLALEEARNRAVNPESHTDVLSKITALEQGYAILG